MKTRRATNGTIFFDFHESDIPLLHSLFRHVLEEVPFGGDLFGRFREADYRTFHVFDDEIAGFVELMKSAMDDLADDLAAGGHDEKIASERESELMLDLLDRLHRLVQTPDAVSESPPSRSPEKS
jgi:hypothetical protein